MSLPTLQDILTIDKSPTQGGEAMYKFQYEHLANYSLLKDNALILPITKYHSPVDRSLIWLNKGEICAGSYAANSICRVIGVDAVAFNDIDIYFKSKDDAKEFAKLNDLRSAIDWNDAHMCIMTMKQNYKINLIFGVEYSSPEALISSFDIRAISVAIDGPNNISYAVDGAFQDLRSKNIVFNPTPRATSINRLVKYLGKGFTLDSYQRLFFAELIRSDIYSSQLELSTGY